jgi:hypothetical protein
MDSAIKEIRSGDFVVLEGSKSEEICRVVDAVKKNRRTHVHVQFFV